jgi:hypothetical protein
MSQDDLIEHAVQHSTYGAVSDLDEFLNNEKFKTIKGNKHTNIANQANGCTYNISDDPIPFRVIDHMKNPLNTRTS